jgi:flagellar assembly factor FliW
VDLGDADRVRLGAREGDPLLWLAVVRVDQDAPTINLRAPVAINARSMQGIQVIPGESPYSTAHPLPVE